MKHGTMQLLFSKIADQLYRNPVQAVRSSGARGDPQRADYPYMFCVAQFCVAQKKKSSGATHNVLIIRTCFALHNFCQEHSQPVDVRPPRGRRSVHIDERPHMTGVDNLQPVHVLAGEEAEEHHR
eukprot:3183201-Rhodomonas_salina.1